MKQILIELLLCPNCGKRDLRNQAFSETGDGKILDGVIWCSSCYYWYPIEDELLDFLIGDLTYKEDRRRFVQRYSIQLKALGLDISLNMESKKKTNMQKHQQTHFDWYAQNKEQTYQDYEKTPFWLAADQIAFEPWTEEIQSGSILLDVGCAQGRSTFKFMDFDISILGIDVSKHLVRQAITRYRQGDYRAEASFIAADANILPLMGESMDYILVYGVLHHLPKPNKVCHEIARVLKPGGIYFGSENNKSFLRFLFEILQKIMPLWYEEAGPEALISKGNITQWFHGTDVKVQIMTSVFLPPHLLNLIAEKKAYHLLKLFDKIGQALPFFKDNGGLLLIHGSKKS